MHVAYGSSTMAFEDINRAPQQLLYCQSFIRLLNDEQVVRFLMCAGFGKSLLHDWLYACLFVVFDNNYYQLASRQF